MEKNIAFKKRVLQYYGLLINKAYFKAMKYNFILISI